MTLLTAASVVLRLAGRVPGTLVLGPRLVGVPAQTVIQLQREEMSNFLRERERDGQMSRVRQFKEWLQCYDNNFNVSSGDFSGNEGGISEDEMKDGCGESSAV